jgi:hypothetical protein
MADVARHFEQIKHWIPEEEHNAFRERMSDCIEDETAWCTDNTFLYYQKDNKRMAHGVALFGKEHTEELISMFVGLFSFEDKETCMMRFQLHPGKFMEEYRSLLTTTSMKRHHADPSHPLMIRVDKFREKIYQLAETLQK